MKEGRHERGLERRDGEMGSDGGGWSVRWRDGSRAGDDGGL